MSSRKLVVFLLSIAFVFSRYAPVYAEQATFDQLHQQYLSLRNTDLSFARLQEWNLLRDKFVQLATKEKDPFIAQRALLEGAILSQTISAKIDPQKNQLRALAMLEELVGRFPKGTLADDALLQEAEILYQRGERREAQALLKQISEKYPDSDMALVAKERLSAARTATTSTQAKATQSSGKPIIVLDPGHGGEDFGAVGVGGLLEKDVALDISIKTKKLLEQKGVYTVILTRSRDSFVPLADRMAFANQKSARLFVSIHANASVRKDMSGVETYYLDNKADNASLKLAERENRSYIKGGNEGEDLSFILSDLIQNAKLPESIALARSLQRSVVQSLKTAAPATKDIGAKSGPFYVLVGAHMPCALVEVSFIDHQEEGKRLGESRTRELIAEGIAKGIEQLK